MPDWELLLTDARIATMRADAADYGVIEDGAIAISDGKIAWIGPQMEMPDNAAASARSLDGEWVTHAMIDCVQRI